MPLMNEIVGLARKKYPGESDPNLVAKQLKTVANLHRWAPWLVTRATEWLQEWPPETRRELFILMEDAIRQRFTGGDSLIPPAELALFANGPPSQLRNRLEKGWILLGKLWPKLNGAARKNLVCDHKTGLRHEKGYNHVLEDLKSLALEHRLITMAEL